MNSNLRQALIPEHLQLDIYAVEADEIKLVERYWGMDRQGHFLEKVSDLLPFRDLNTPQKLNDFINTISTLWDNRCTCSVCEQGIPIKARSNLNQHRPAQLWVCYDCWELGEPTLSG